METVFIEATNTESGGINHGKFMVGRFTPEEWSRASLVNVDSCQLKFRGWTPGHILVLDLQTGEGSIFRHGGCAKADLDKHQIWVCPLFESFLHWLYSQDVSDLKKLPQMVSVVAPSAIYGHRRPGHANDAKKNVVSSG